MIRRLATAIAFLTRIPVNPAVPFDGTDVARSSIFFPLVGCLIGLLQLALLALLNALSVPLQLQALAATVLVVLVGGGLHQDGLADMADGFGGGFTKEKVLDIMRDSVIGTYGALALILSLSVRVVALSLLLAVESGWVWIVVAATVSRCSHWLGWLMPYARQSGTGESLTRLTGPQEVIGATLTALLVTIVCVGLYTPLVVGLAALMFLLMAWICHRKIGGITGDTLGATTEVTEVLLLGLGATVVGMAV